MVFNKNLKVVILYRVLNPIKVLVMERFYMELIKNLQVLDKFNMEFNINLEVVILYRF